MRNLEALHCKDLKIHLKAFTKLRDYQSDALRSCVITNLNNTLTAKSGYIVLPCGAGKTLLGISICAKIKK
jgi:superfamily II DNA or RNA helicase